MSQKRLVQIVFSLAVGLFPMVGGAQEPDFVVALNTCKTSVGYMNLENDVNVVEGDLAAYACQRRSNKVMCVLTNYGEGGTEEETMVEFEVDMDSPPLLFLKTNKYADFMMINTTERSAATITRIVHQQFLAAKVCHGMFMTSSDLEALRDDE